MLRWTCSISLAIACASAAHGATLSVSSDKLTLLRLSFFGLTNAPGTSFTIGEQVPEPATAGLLALGLIALAAARRGGGTS